MIGIYQILNTSNGKRYIGSSVNVENRITSHDQALRSNRHPNVHLQSSYNTYGKDSFQSSIILICSKDDRLFYEDLIIKGYNTLDQDFGFNLREVQDNGPGIKRSSRHKDLSGTRFNNLVLIEECGVSVAGHIQWLCLCDCGVISKRKIATLRSGQTKSCGCLVKKRAQEVGQKNKGRKHINRKRKI